MKRSEINQLVHAAGSCFESHGWTLPPRPAWDVTDFGLGDIRHFGLVLVNLANEPEYCEKLMYACRGMVTPSHTHRRKKEDIICRWGALKITLWNGLPDTSSAEPFFLKVCGEPVSIHHGQTLTLPAGYRVTIPPGIYHEFFPETEECIIGEVSTANDDVSDNFFVRQDIGRFPGIEEDEPALIRILGES
jgi:D-lyxose ketol-isomerase